MIKRFWRCYLFKNKSINKELNYFLQWEKCPISAIPRKERCSRQAGNQYQVVLILWENDLNRKGSPRQENLQINFVNSLEVWKYSLGSCFWNRSSPVFFLIIVLIRAPKSINSLWIKCFQFFSCLEEDKSMIWKEVFSAYISRRLTTESGQQYNNLKCLVTVFK